jgi:hypothetical protein
MYLVLIYIILVFYFIIFTKNVNIEEGQSLESYNYLEFQPIINNDSLSKKLKDHLNKYSDDMDNILTNTIDKYKNKTAIKDDIDSGKSREDILYDIYVRDSLDELNIKEDSDDSYKNYLKNYDKFHDIEYSEKKGNPYSGDQVKLFKNKRKPTILYSNELDYVDKEYYKDIIKDKKQDETSLPGLIDELNGKVLDNMRINKVEDNENTGNINISNTEFCCDYSGLKIENMPILDLEELNKVNHRMRDINHEDVDLDKDKDKESVYAYNYPYYEYMKGEGLLYKPLYLNYNKTRNIGSINL